MSRSSKRPMGSGWSDEGIVLFNRLFNAVEEDRRDRGQLFVQSLLTIYAPDGTTVGKPTCKAKLKAKTKAKTNLKRKWYVSDATLESDQYDNLPGSSDSDNIGEV